VNSSGFNLHVNPHSFPPPHQRARQHLTPKQTRYHPTILQILQTLEQILRLLHREIVVSHLGQRDPRALVLAFAIGSPRSPEVFDVVACADGDGEEGRGDEGAGPGGVHLGVEYEG